MEEKEQLIVARKRIKALEAALSDMHVDRCQEHAFLEVACEQLDVPLDDFKKTSERAQKTG